MYIVTGFSGMIFSCSGDSLVQKSSLYVESNEYVEVYDGVWIILVCSRVGCDRAFPYGISRAV